jgi:aminoglycoside phosphotransferase (APT) family kinase protein
MLCVPVSFTVLQVCLCEDASVLGTPFYVMEHVRGRIFTDVALPDLAPAQRAAVYEVRAGQSQPRSCCCLRDYKGAQLLT